MGLPGGQSRGTPGGRVVVVTGGIVEVVLGGRVTGGSVGSGTVGSVGSVGRSVVGVGVDAGRGDRECTVVEVLAARWRCRFGVGRGVPTAGADAASPD